MQRNVEKSPSQYDCLYVMKDSYCEEVVLAVGPQTGRRTGRRVQRGRLNFATGVIGGTTQGCSDIPHRAKHRWKVLVGLCKKTPPKFSFLDFTEIIAAEQHLHDL
jgi:hypothetical protein